MTTEQGYKRILVATDFSPSADAALQQAVWLARKVDAKITLAHTLPDLRGDALRIIPGEVGSVIRRRQYLPTGSATEIRRQDAENGRRSERSRSMAACLMRELKSTNTTRVISTPKWP